MPPATTHIPERRCIVSGQTSSKTGLIRFAVSPDGILAPDVTGKLPGRGLWVSAERGALEKAIGKNLFAKAARQPLQLPEALLQIVEQQLIGRVTSLLGLARKSGKAVCGYEKVKDWLSKDKAVILAQASDGSTRGKGKLRTPEGAHFVGWLTSDELGMAFRRETVIHCAVASGGLSVSIVDEALRLKGVRFETKPQPTRKRTKEIR